MLFEIHLANLNIDQKKNEKPIHECIYEFDSLGTSVFHLFHQTSCLTIIFFPNLSINQSTTQNLKRMSMSIADKANDIINNNKFGGKESFESN